jgi:hypothetical protein
MQGQTQILAREILNGALENLHSFSHIDISTMYRVNSTPVPIDV